MRRALRKTLCPLLCKFFIPGGGYNARHVPWCSTLNCDTGLTSNRSFSSMTLILMAFDLLRRSRSWIWYSRKSWIFFCTQLSEFDIFVHEDKNTEITINSTQSTEVEIVFQSINNNIFSALEASIPALTWNFNCVERYLKSPFGGLLQDKHRICRILNRLKKRFGTLCYSIPSFIEHGKCYRAIKRRIRKAPDRFTSSLDPKN